MHGAADGKLMAAGGSVHGTADGRLRAVAGRPGGRTSVNDRVANYGGAACKIGVGIETIGYYVTAQSQPRDVLVDHEISVVVDLLAADGLKHLQLIGAHQAFTPVFGRHSIKV